MTPSSQFGDKFILLWFLAAGLALLVIAAGVTGGPCLATTAAIVGWIVWRYAASRPAKIFCTFCGKCILSDTNWTCGFCSHRNDWRTWYYSFLNKCRRCKMPPAIYACHYCDTPIPLVEGVNLDSAKEVLHAAYHLTPPELPGELPPSREDERKEALAEVEFEVALNRLKKERAETIRELRLAEEKNQTKPASDKPKSRRERLEEELARERDEHLALEEVAAAARKTVEEQFADDPETKDRQLEVIERWRERHVE